ncbi:hypothetical protein BT69DRAFT_1210752 [Atractiella rhizophila]|nr:hypothetical protein BT69DRAFT_1211226 [Atractiella rhizophila]KAH8930090.1 hypothetical protein BT69DRAFT_1210752 [Atractiella rhizophila]
MPVTLHGSCHCGEVNYTVESNTPVPYQMCSCSICRMTGGFMGNVNIMANTNTLKVTKGEDKISKYVAHKDGKKVNSTRNFCSNCSSMLWLHDPSWDAWGAHIFPSSSIPPET